MRKLISAAICLLLMLCSCAFAEDLPQAVQSLICEGGLLGGMPGDALRINCADGEQYCFVLSKDSYWLLGYVCRGENQEAWVSPCHFERRWMR